MSHRKLSVRCDTVYPAMIIEKRRSWRHKLVYVLRADRRVRHYKGKSEKNNYERNYSKRGSRIVYIGQTSVGDAKMVRPSYSAVRKGERAFREIVGVKRVEVHLVTATRRKGVENVAAQLERGLLAAFHQEYGALPCYNKQGEKYELRQVKYFSPARLRTVIDDLS